LKNLQKRDTLEESKQKTKTMKKQQNQTVMAVQSLLSSHRRKQVSLFVVALALAFTGSVMPIWQQVAEADQYQDQINQLNSENSNTRSLVNDLQSQASSYQDAINKLQGQINGLQASINTNVATQNELQRQIEVAQAEIDRQRATLASDIKAMYVDGTPDTLEMLATSKNLSEFVDKQEYRSRVQSKIQDTMANIAELQKQLQSQKVQIETLIKEQQVQQSLLDTDRAKQQELLSMNQGQQSSYNAQISANTQKVAELRRAQAEAIRKMGGSAVLGDSGDNTYPARWKAAPLDAYVDNWGMYTRECVSYTAWKVYEAYGNMPYWGGIGKC
jgi:peptidoglycan DL-endopeptidase CwlO